MLPFKISASVVGLAVLGVSLVAERPIQESKQVPPRFTARADLVRMDVGVLDSRRRPIKGLAADDFTITVDGIEQPVVAISEVEVPRPAAAPPAWRNGIGAHVATNAVDDARTFLIILDDVLLVSQRSVVSAQRIARAVVDQLASNDLAAIVFSRDNRQAQDFTRDKALLYAAIETVKGGDSALDKNLRSLNVLRAAVKMMATMPARRNSIVYITPGPRVQSTPVGSTNRGSDVSPVERLQALTREGTLANVRIYPFSTSGLPVSRGAVAPNEFLRDVAHQTGGRATVDHNVPQQEVPQMFAENDVYYLVGYRPTYPPSDGRMRRLTIAVKRRGATVVPSTRYFEADEAPTSDANSSDAAAPPVVSALTGLLPDTGLPLRLLVEPLGPSTADKAAPILTAVRLGITGLSDGAPLREGERFAIETRVFDGEGRKEIVTHKATGRGVLSSPALLDVTYELALKPGRYNVRVAVRREADGRTGGVYATVVVPEYRSDALSVSDSRLLTATNGTGRVVTTRRAFAAGESLAVAVDLHRGARLLPAPVSVALRIEDINGTARDARSDALGPDTPNAVTRHYDIDTRDWPAGAYLITVTVLRATAPPVDRKVLLEITR